MKKGFTIIELLVLIAIIAILSTVVMAGFNSARMKVECKKDQFSTECQEYIKKGGVLTSSDDTKKKIDCEDYATLTKDEIQTKMPVGCLDYFNLILTK
jgi:prepilin-type N-terminal cleavage/methylation domain-containing protein